MYLSGEDICEYISSEKLGITPFNEKNLTPNGYDICADEVMIDGNVSRDDILVIPAGAHALVSTVEYIKMSNELAAQLWLRTSLGRKGIVSAFGLVDAGFEGNLTLCMYNSSSSDIQIEKGKRIVQMAFVPLKSSAEKTYKERSGNYQGQKGATLSKD